MSALLADCGNSCVKLAASEDPSALRYLAYDDPLFAETLAEKAGQHDELIYTYGSERGAEQMLAAWPHRARCIGTDIPLPDCGQYASMGHDRILAGIGAISRHRSDLIVVDAGTAVTVDAWRYDPALPAGCRFDGGCIAPGPQAMLAGLHSLAPALPLPTIEEPLPFPGHDTRSSLLAGCGQAFRGGCEGLVSRLRQSSGIALVVATGGWMDADLARAIGADHGPEADILLLGMRHSFRH